MTALPIRISMLSGGRHEHHVERAVHRARARPRDRKQQHLNEREHGNEARHDRVAGDPVLVPTRAVAHLDGRAAAVLRVDLRVAIELM